MQCPVTHNLQVAEFTARCSENDHASRFQYTTNSVRREIGIHRGPQVDPIKISISNDSGLCPIQGSQALVVRHRIEVLQPKIRCRIVPEVVGFDIPLPSPE